MPKPMFRTGLGYQSNLLEVNEHRDAPKSSGFQESEILLRQPLPGSGRLTAIFHATFKDHFQHRKLNEYLLAAGVDWHAIDEEDEDLVLNVHGGLFQEPVGGAFLHRQREAAETGRTFGSGWKWERDVGDLATLTWNGDAEYQDFDREFGDNIEIKSDVIYSRDISDDLKWFAGPNVDVQHYPHRPSDDESIGNRSLTTIESRGVLGLNFDWADVWHAELEVTGGWNSDLSDGYYDASVLGARGELRWEPGSWKFITSIEPEAIWFRHRPANIDLPFRSLSTREYVFELRAEYAWSARISTYLQETVHIQRTNSDEVRDDATLNRFTDHIVSAGFSITF